MLPPQETTEENRSQSIQESQAMPLQDRMESPEVYLVKTGALQPEVPYVQIFHDFHEVEERIQPVSPIYPTQSCHQSGYISLANGIYSTWSRL